MVDRQARQQVQCADKHLRVQNLAYGQGGFKLEINIPPQHILAKSKGGL